LSPSSLREGSGVVLEDPAPVALAAFVVALAIVTTAFLAVDVVSLIFDCCVLVLPEEDHHLPPTLRMVPRFRHGPRCPPLLIVAARGGRHPPSPATALPRQLHGLIPYLLVFSLSHRKESHTKSEGIV